ncbi:hypothetical protein RN001_009183 [Aquatica leii]|uniref:Major facilitator superfamily (MFS) profile domain-containing protein n=1 Tax=Aquatica leii TaxID=1421715 RepID=A0AAN7SDP4_9COLE|nr:hypothetical protein RN001_009183 [Aquatica leii]
MKFVSYIYKRVYLYQYLATITSSFSVLSLGINTAWTSPYLPQILNGTYPYIKMTSDEGSWLAVMPPLASPVGAIIGAHLVDGIGRKNTALMMAPLTCIMFISLAFAKTLLLLCIIRFVIGCVSPILYTVLPMYLGEIADPSIRGILIASVAFSSLVGSLFINVLGFYYSIFTSSLICATIPIIHFLTFVWMPESPYYFIKQNREEDARKALITLRGTTDIEAELKTLSDVINAEKLENKEKFTDLFTVRSNRLGLFIFVVLNVTRKFSGSSPFLFYTATIFQTAGGSVNTNLSVIIFLCIQIASAMVSLNVLDYLGRRPVIITSSTACILALSITGTYFFLKDYKPEYITNLGWLPLTILTVYMVFYNLGLELSPIVYAGELFPTNVKAKALSFVDTISALNGIITLKMFQILTDNYGMYLPFWVFGTCCTIGLILIVKYVPETKNKTLEEIHIELMRRSGESNSDK